MTFDPSVVSLKELSRFLKFVEFFQKYYSIKNECKNEKKIIMKTKKIMKKFIK